MSRLFALASLGFSMSIANAASFLISPQEMLASNNAPVTFTAKALPVKDAPLIYLVTPQLGAPIASPTPIELKFESIQPSKVKVETFKVLYGAFQIDITKRILGVAAMTQQGVQVREANLPAGKHKLTVILEDSEGRVGEKQIEFEVR